MFKGFIGSAVVAGLVVSVGMSLGCDRITRSPTQPTAPTQPPPDSNRPGSPPSVTSMSPEVGSIDGTYFKITGAGFVVPRVTLGGVLINQSYSPDPTTIHVTTAAHVAGTFDVVVTNRDGQSATAPGGFTYAAPESFEVDGAWEGGADSNYETLLRFTIQNNALTSVSCGTSATVTFSSPVPIIHGAFSGTGDDRTSISGRLLSSNNAIGTVSMPSCFGYPWFATRQ